SQGAFGAQWTATLWATNASANNYNIACTKTNCTRLNANSTVTLSQPYSDLNHPGFFLHAVTGFNFPFESVAFDLRITNSATTPSSSAGTEIPLVRPNDFQPYALFPSVPVNGHSRLRLWLYGLKDGRAT